MKTFRFLFAIALLPFVALAQNVNVQKASTTNAITADLNFPNARTLTFGTTTPGGITGLLGALTLTAAGTNQNILLAPSGSGGVAISNTDTQIKRNATGRVSLVSTSATVGFDLFEGATNSATIQTVSGVLKLVTQANQPITFQVNGVEKGRFAATTGALLLGTTTDDTVNALQNAGYTKSAAYKGATDTLSGAGAISVTNDTTKLTSTGVGQALTLADGADGQIKRIIHDVDGGSAILTPTTKTGWSTATFTNAGDSLTLEFVTTRGWIVMGSYGTVVAP